MVSQIALPVCGTLERHIKSKKGKNDIMAWEERTVKEMREEFVRRVLAKEKSKALRCAGVQGSAVPQDKSASAIPRRSAPVRSSRAPQRQAGRVSPEMEASIVQLRQQYPALGAEKLRKIMENRGGERICPVRTFNSNIFARHHLITRTQVWRRLSSALKKEAQRYAADGFRETCIPPTAFAHHPLVHSG
ncbi:MAG: hypothetical protein ACLVB5_05215 [Christensenellales bacterium]